MEVQTPPMQSTDPTWSVVAGLLADAEANLRKIQEDPEGCGHPFSRARVSRAVALLREARDLIPRARTEDRETDGRDAKIILAWIARKGLGEFREREILQDLRRRFPNYESLRAPLAALVRDGSIRPRAEPIDPSRRGPKPTPAYEVTPRSFQSMRLA